MLSERLINITKGLPIWTIIIGETVSAVSIRIPLSSAYENINTVIFKLSVILRITLFIVAGLSIYLINRWVFTPLALIENKANAISNNPDRLGEQIEQPPGRELAKITDNFNTMSSKLRQEMDNLEFRVNDRTKDLKIANKELTEAVNKHKETISKLKIALSEVKTLRGILPICSHCKKIRDDEGYWNQIEAYIENHSEADMSHSVCPECAKKYYPDYDLYDE